MDGPMKILFSRDSMELSLQYHARARVVPGRYAWMDMGRLGVAWMQEWMAR
jgi:hypothetical protein